MSYEFIESPNYSSRNGNQVGGIIAHGTASGDLGATVRYMCNKVKAPKGSEGRGFVIIDGIPYYDAKASAHYCTGRDGRTVQLVRDNMSAWHAGSTSTKPKLNGRGQLNLWTIGHEIANWLGLREKDGKYYCWPDNWSKEYVGPKPICKPTYYKAAETYFDKNGEKVFPDGTISYWEPYTDEQIEATIKLWSEIVSRYGIKKEFIAGHDQVDPTRKIDPGPLFPYKYIIDAIYNQNKEKSDLLYAPQPPTDILSGELSDEVVMAEAIIDDDRSKIKEISICNLAAKILFKG